jgi:hypothetical protein
MHKTNNKNNTLDQVELSSSQYKRPQSTRSRLKTAIFNLMKKKDFEKLDLLIDSFSPEDLVKFYEEEGFSLLCYSIVGPAIESFEYLLTRLPKKVVIAELKKDKFCLLKSMFVLYKEEEDKSKLQTYYEMIINVSKINEPEVKKFVEENRPIQLIEY